LEVKNRRWWLTRPLFDTTSTFRKRRREGATSLTDGNIAEGIEGFGFSFSP
jgi:hypothetical protein